MNRITKYLIILGVALLPVYVFDSGGMQPSHLLLFTYSIIILIARGFPVRPWSVALVALFLYASAVESFYVILGGDLLFLINAVFFLFNFIVVAAIYTHVRETGLKTLRFGVMFTAAIAFGAVAYFGVNLSELDGQGRPTGAFNNPNQLGYFSVCLLSFTYLLYREKQLSYWMAAAIFSIAMFLAIASLSKAAMISNFAVIVLALKPVRSRSAVLGWALAGLIGLLYLFQQYQGGAFDDLLFVKRLANMAREGDSSLEARGYFAFLHGTPLHLLFGMGTQNINEIVGHEVHSTFASILNNYGLFGLMIFSAAIFIWAARLWQYFGLVGFICLTVPPMAYGITHDGTRFTFFWLLFAASMALAERERRSSSLQPMAKSIGSVRV
ncbi:hypothetical protein [Notoacmeibacter sp. MSK16QG-6]|uniref:hypothetical protein n=1 Tax=Notoacmeibacter sp. MSK16QG-6 TaxID=2957982 RepID=UPI0020A1526E|nr:hypothetical protein [Notoacmeibacter sp. MSK16QG-6]MCP1198058.1 hypothetical protein [Notoacmeibacter sp. MSK16QG-6]